MLQGIEAEIDLARRVGVPVDGDYAAFFAELVKDREKGTGIRDQGRSDRAGAELMRRVGNPGDALIKAPAHAVTSSWRVASSDPAQGLRRSASGAEMKGSPSTRISRRAPPVAPMGATKKRRASA